VMLQWPNIGDFIDHQDQDMPEPGELVDEYCNRVSDIGLPISEDGMKLLEKLDDEMQKRDQNSRGVYVCNDWNGYGMSEVMENFVSALVRNLAGIGEANARFQLKDFNRDVFKKTKSPFEKWAYVEGFVAYILVGDIDEWMSTSPHWLFEPSFG
jgi:hypothetical protein